MVLGGAEKHEHHEPFRVPDWRNHEINECPELLDYKMRLKRLGMKDPFIRNYWPLFNPRNPTWTRGAGHQVILRKWWMFSRFGLKPGATIAGVIIATEEMYSYMKYGHTSWGGIWCEYDEHEEHH